MNTAIITRILGLFLFLFSLTLLPPLFIALYTADGEAVHFADSIGLLALIGFALWLPNRKAKGNLRVREAFVVVTLFWTVLGILGGLPLVLGAKLSVTDAAFEAVSAFTTTGATVIVGIDNLPPSILMYRQQLQWLGGIGFVVLAVAVLPMLGVGGMQLFRAETPGPMKDEKITPRIAHTARALWWVYVGLTIACAFAYWGAGMSAFDAIAHSLSTLSTGGFSTHDASLAFFNSPLIETIAVVFMLAGGISFTVHFLALRRRDPRIYWRDPQVKTFLAVVLTLTAVIAASLFATGTIPDPFNSLRYATFTVASVITSTGFGTTDFSLWPLFLPVLLIFSSFIGGCAGSTAGGMKVIRFIILAKEGNREMMRLIHPNLVRPIKLGGKPLSERVVDAVWGFFSLYVAVFVVLMLLVMATGIDQVTAFGAIATSMNNLGPGLGDVSSNFASVNPVAKWICVFAMLLGRLEIFTMLALLSPDFWRK